MRSLFLLWVLIASPALAKPWNGIEPGISPREAVVKKFGEPTQVTASGSQDVLSYSQAKAIRGTAQAQFRVNHSTGAVDRIDVFPAADLVLDQAAIEKSYGAECEGAEREGCYVRRTQDKKPPYFLYAKLGLAVFFKEDNTVQSFAFLPSKK